MIAIIEEVECLKNPLDRDLLGYLERLRRSEIEREEFIFKPQRVAPYQVRKRPEEASPSITGIFNVASGIPTFSSIGANTVTA